MSETKQKETMVVKINFNVANVAAIKDVMNDEDCKGLQFTFDRVVVPTGGSTQFQMPSGNSEEPLMVKEIVGVVLFNHPSNAYYKEKYTGKQVPPDCYLLDGICGITNNGEKKDCRTCPFNQYGSGGNNSKACKNKRMLFILVEGQLFPIMLHLPTGSLKSFTQYMKSLKSMAKRMSQVVTKITLKKAMNSTGIAYSQCVFDNLRDLDENEINAISPVIDVVKEYAFSRPIITMDAQEDDVNKVFDENAKNLTKFRGWLKVALFIFL